MEEKNEEKIRIMIADDFPLLLEDMCELIEIGRASCRERV